MFLRYVLPNGEQKDVELKKQSITIGRGNDADISIPDKLSSRLHCGISFWNDAYFIRDFKSKNGTSVNGKRIDVVRLHAGDQIKVGSTVFSVEKRARSGTETAVREVKQKMDDGKGYHTILHEIIKEEE